MTVSIRIFEMNNVQYSFMAIERLTTRQFDLGEDVISGYYQRLIHQQPGLEAIPAAAAQALIRTGLAEINALEDAALRQFTRPQVSADVANATALLWVLSGPGTQNPNVPIKDTDVAYKDKPWAYGMDRQRGNYAARLLRTIAEVKSGQSPTYGPLNHVYEQKEQTRRMIEAFAPPVFYNGTEMENEGVAWALTQSGVIVPRDSITVSGQGIKKTVDQVKDFKVPESVKAAGREIGIVSHAPHLVRAVHMINRYRPLPDDTRIRLYPLPTPSNGRQEYAEMELRGLLYYTFLSPDRDTTPEAYPYKIF